MHTCLMVLRLLFTLAIGFQPLGGLDGLFWRRNSEGFVGHCLFVFFGVRRFDFIVTPYARIDGVTKWLDPINFSYHGKDRGDVSEYRFEGGLQGISSSVNAIVEAQRFELHILGEGEPARQG